MCNTLATQKIDSSVHWFYTLPKSASRGATLERFRQSEAQFRELPNLIRKYFCYGEGSLTGPSVYLWESEAAARDFFSEVFLAGFEEKFGCLCPNWFSWTP